MNKSIIIKLLVAFAVLTSLASCKKDNEKQVYFWGQTDYYKDFLWKHYQDTIMPQTLTFETGEDHFTKPITFELYTIDNNTGAYIPVNVNDVKLFKNGEPCPENKLVVNPGESEVVAGVMFANEAPEGKYNWFLKVTDSGDLDMINNTMTSAGEIPMLIEWNAKKNDIMNPLAKTVTIIGVFILVVLLLWLFLVICTDVFFAKFTSGMNNIYLNYQDKTSYNLRQDFHVTPKGCKRIVITNRHQHQGALAGLFLGKVKYAYIPDENWPVDLLLNPGRNRIRATAVPSSEYDIDNDFENRRITVIRESDKFKSVIEY